MRIDGPNWANKVWSAQVIDTEWVKHCGPIGPYGPDLKITGKLEFTEHAFVPAKIAMAHLARLAHLSITPFIYKGEKKL